MRKNKIPTLIGLIILVLGLVSGIALIRTQKFFSPKASPEENPRDVRITNVTDTTATISWVTEKESLGFVKWGQNPQSLNKTQKSDFSEPSFTHSLTINSLSPSSSYYFVINSGGEEFDNGGTPWQLATGNTLQAKTPYLVSGVINDSTDKPIENALIYLTVGGGSPVSTTTSANGTWVTSIASTRSQSLDSLIILDESVTLVEIFVNGGPLGVASAKTFPKLAKPTPTITLGKSFDFRNLTATTDDAVSDALLELPEDTNRTSKFKVDEADGELSENVTIESVVQGEIVTTADPEFFGQGPDGDSITVKLESEVITENIKVDGDGRWRWSPTTVLSDGAHKLTITWKDKNGVTKTLVRNFVVQAAEGPAFESTPSASLTPSISPSPSPSPSVSPSPSPKLSPSPKISPSPIVTPSPSSSPIPLLDSGSLTPTLLLFMMGIGTLMLGILVWKRSDT